MNIYLSQTYLNIRENIWNVSKLAISIFLLCEIMAFKLHCAVFVLCWIFMCDVDPCRSVVIMRDYGLLSFCDPVMKASQARHMRLVDLLQFLSNNMASTIVSWCIIWYYILRPMVLSAAWSEKPVLSIISVIAVISIQHLASSALQ